MAEPTTHALYQASLAELCKRYGITSDHLRPVRGVESSMYEYTVNGNTLMFRISHSSRRTPQMVLGEADWIDYLCKHGVPAAKAIPSKNGSLVEYLDLPDGTQWTAVAFQKAKGRAPRDADLTPSLYTEMGRIMGRMHTLTKDYQPTSPSARPSWSEEVQGFAEKYLSQEDVPVIDVWNDILSHLRQLPNGRDDYGLVHIDIHPGNFFVDHSDITLFDFDDCQYAWFANDLAVSTFYAVPHHCESPRDLEAAKRIYDALMDGYVKEATLDAKWLQEIPVFLTYREIDLYINIIKHHGPGPYDDEWCASYMRNRRSKILNGVPYIPISFT